MIDATELPSTSLYLREGGSDKEYHARIEAKDEGFVVNFAYGRRGAALSIGTKTSAPTTREAATKIYEKLLHEKKAKGYTPSADGKAFAMTEKAGDISGLLPQLLNPIEETDALGYLCDDAWVMEEKQDGRRLMVRVTAGTVEGANRKGLLVSLPKEIEEALKDDADCVLDGELVGAKLFVFDLLAYAGEDLSGKNYLERLTVRNTVVFSTPSAVEAVETFVGAEAKTVAYRRLLEAGKEGVVFKRADAPYKIGRPAAGGSQVKYKFYATCSAVVGTVNQQRSVGLLLEGVNVGNVTISPNFEVPNPGDVVEVRYLYYNPQGALYQPCYLGVRDDIDAAECTLSQLKHKSTLEE
ncbi:MAG: ligase [Chthonomonadales bacterium]|nr:ligase [Chthonomonadales bacterium]